MASYIATRARESQAVENLRVERDKCSTESVEVMVDRILKLQVFVKS